MNMTPYRMGLLGIVDTAQEVISNLLNMINSEVPDDTIKSEYGIVVEYMNKMVSVVKKSTDDL